MKQMISLLVMIIIALYVQSCSTHSGPKVTPTGKEKKASTTFLESGARMLQSNPPVAQMDVYLVGFHPMKAQPHLQMEAHHFCREVNEDFSQCALFDGNTKEANLTGIEYIISENLFKTLPATEKKFWHPHNYEILSGQLIAPGLPDAAEKAFMKKKINSYGKTWHVWNTGHHGLSDAAKLPMGEPMLAWSFNRDGEARSEMLKDTEKKFNLNLEDKRKNRKDLTSLTHPQDGVDALKGKFKGKTKPVEGVKEQGP